MSIKAILTTLLLGSSAAALADPVVRDHRDGNDRRSHADDNQLDDGSRGRAGRDGHHARFGRSVMLAEDIQLSGRAQRPAFVSIHPRAGGIRKLRLDVDNGRVYIESVLVMFADGHRQAMPVRKILARRDPSLTLELPHGGVTGVYIYGAPARQTHYGYGYVGGNAGTIDVIGLRR